MVREAGSNRSLAACVASVCPLDASNNMNARAAIGGAAISLAMAVDVATGAAFAAVGIATSNAEAVENKSDWKYFFIGLFNGLKIMAIEWWQLSGGISELRFGNNR